METETHAEMQMETQMVTGGNIDAESNRNKKQQMETQAEKKMEEETERQMETQTQEQIKMERIVMESQKSVEGKQ